MAESTGALNVSDRTLKEALGIIEKLGAVACIHAEDEETRKSLVHHLKGVSKPEYYSKSRPRCQRRSPWKKRSKWQGTQKSIFVTLAPGKTLK